MFKERSRNIQLLKFKVRLKPHKSAVVSRAGFLNSLISLCQVSLLLASEKIWGRQQSHVPFFFASSWHDREDDEEKRGEGGSTLITMMAGYRGAQAFRILSHSVSM